MMSEYREDMKGRELIAYIFRETTDCNLMTTRQILGDGFYKDMRTLVRQVKDARVSRLTKAICRVEIGVTYFMGELENLQHEIANRICQ